MDEYVHVHPSLGRTNPSTTESTILARTQSSPPYEFHHIKAKYVAHIWIIHTSINSYVFSNIYWRELDT